MRLWVYQSLAKTRWNLSLPLHPHPPNSSPLWWPPWTRSETTKSPYSSKPSSRETFHWYLTFIYLSTRDTCGIFYETCHFNIILLFMDLFYFTRWCFIWNGTTLAQRVVLPPQRLCVTRSCVTPCVSARSVHPYSRSDLKNITFVTTVIIH